MDYNVYFSVAKIEARYTSKEQTNRDFTESSYISSFFKAFFDIFDITLYLIAMKMF